MPTFIRGVIGQYADRPSQNLLPTFLHLCNALVSCPQNPSGQFFFSFFPLLTCLRRDRQSTTPLPSASHVRILDFEGNHREETEAPFLQQPSLFHVGRTARKASEIGIEVARDRTGLLELLEAAVLHAGAMIGQAFSQLRSFISGLRGLAGVVWCKAEHLILFLSNEEHALAAWDDYILRFREFFGLESDEDEDSSSDEDDNDVWPDE
ncbi:uncharacterized protein LOC119399248 [Rhipicephalus sanguineus]|uniref:uncharacterized protein LOC119399248 n=1 Tax=Rhipicephalus sanguineus TaxID=34632 RepID=UPI001894C65C|nr:uncharacterized protein LOC119399248 [Rhipicephalus sanguineus]